MIPAEKARFGETDRPRDPAHRKRASQAGLQALLFYSLNAFFFAAFPAAKSASPAT